MITNSFTIEMSSRLVREVLTPNATRMSSRLVLGLVNEAMLVHEIWFYGAATLISTDVKEEFKRIGREIFSDGIIHQGRIIVLLALATYLQKPIYC